MRYVYRVAYRVVVKKKKKQKPKINNQLPSSELKVY